MADPYAGWKAFSCGVCGSSGNHSTDDCPYKAKRTFDEAGEAVMRDHRGEYNELDLLWTHPQSGSRVFLGNYTASKSLETLERWKVSHVVNCMARNTDSSLKDRFEYYRFPIETWEGEMVRRGGDPGGASDGDFVASKYFARLFGWLDDAMTHPDQAVLVHCFAGAHRAAAVSVAYLMHASHVNLPEALMAVQTVRPIADPYGHLMELLKRLNADMERTACSAAVEKASPAPTVAGAFGEDQEAVHVREEEAAAAQEAEKEVGAAASVEEGATDVYDASTQRKIDALRKREETHGLNAAQLGILEGLLKSGTPTK